MALFPKMVHGFLNSPGLYLIASLEPVYKHLPDLDCIDGVLNLLSACILVVLGNVLDFRTYRTPNQYEDTNADERLRELLTGIDLNTIPENERKAICYARGVALHVMEWICECCVIKFSDSQVIEDLPFTFFIQVANSIWYHKKFADDRNRNGAPDCTLVGMRRQITNLIESNSKFRKMWNKRKKFPSNSFELADKDKYTVSWIESKRTEWKGSKRSKHCILRDIPCILTPLTRLSGIREDRF